MSRILEGKNIIITGLASKRSIAWAIASAFQSAGANVVGTVQNERMRFSVEKISDHPPLVQMDVSLIDEISVAINDAMLLFGKDAKLDCLVHCIAFAGKEELNGRYIDGDRNRAVQAYIVSAESLRDMARFAEPYMQENGSIIYLTFAASERTYPHYNTMSVCKSALETIGRLLAYDLGNSKSVRVNGISAGPLETLAARGVGDFREIDNVYNGRCLVGKATFEDVAGSAVFLASDASRGITGAILPVDGGFTTVAFHEREVLARKQLEKAIKSVDSDD